MYVLIYIIVKLRNKMEFIIGLIIIISCGSLIGYERQRAHKCLGVRSTILILLGSFLFSIISIRIGIDHSRVIAQIVSGCSFIGAGIIFKNGLDNIQYLTTAILVWVLAALGSLIACEFWLESLITTLVIYSILKFKTQ